MGKRTLWGLGALAVLCLAALGVWLGKDLIWTSATNIQIDFERKEHETFLQSIGDNDESLSAFSTDGCSGGLSTAWRAMSKRFPALAEAHEDTPPWERCCETHDRAYHAAGGAKEPHESYDLRLAADEALKVCVLETGRLRATDLATRYGLSEEQIGNAYKAIANTMFDAVRAGGLPCTGLSWRWGCGYPPCSRPEDTR